MAMQKIMTLGFEKRHISSLNAVEIDHLLNRIDAYCLFPDSAAKRRDVVAATSADLMQKAGLIKKSGIKPGSIPDEYAEIVRAFLAVGGVPRLLQTSSMKAFQKQRHEQFATRLILRECIRLYRGLLGTDHPEVAKHQGPSLEKAIFLFLKERDQEGSIVQAVKRVGTRRAGENLTKEQVGEQILQFFLLNLEARHTKIKGLIEDFGCVAHLFYAEVDYLLTEMNEVVRMRMKQPNRDIRSNNIERYIATSIAISGILTNRPPRKSQRPFVEAVWSFPPDLIEGLKVPELEPVDLDDSYLGDLKEFTTRSMAAPKKPRIRSIAPA